jgi:hypothetical protein
MPEAARHKPRITNANAALGAVTAAPASAAIPWRLTLRASDFPRGEVGSTQTFSRRRGGRQCGTADKAFLGARDRRLVVMGASVGFCRSARAAQAWVDGARLYAVQRNASRCAAIHVRGADVAVDCFDTIGEGHLYLLRRGANAARLAADDQPGGALRRRQVLRLASIQARRLAR